MIISLTGGGTPSKQHPEYWDGEIPWASVKDLKNYKYLDTTRDYITAEGVINSSTNSIDPGHFIVCTRMGLGKAVINRITTAINQDLKAMELPEKLNIDYFYIFYQTLEITGSGVTVSGIKQDDLLSKILLLPPLEEQKRIVAKVDELMALCDKLEVQQQQQANNVLRANTAAINSLLNPADPKSSFEQNWQRIAEHLNTLYGCTLPMPKGQGRKKKHLVGLENVKALRQVILQLAVTGKLVPQNSNNNPANLLIDSIKSTKNELLKAKVINKQSVFSPVFDQDKSFQEPTGWFFVRLGEITNRIGSGSTPRGGKSAYTETGIPFFRSQNVWNDGLKLHDVAYIPEVTHEKMSNTAVYAKDILLNITGASLGRCTLIPDDFKHGNVSQHVTIIRATEPETRKFLHLCILSPYTQSMIWKRQVGMAREGLSKKVLEQFEIPLPPLEEQKCIVAKVEQLMTLCDQLEQQLTQSYSDAEKLMQATIKVLVA